MTIVELSGVVLGIVLLLTLPTLTALGVRRRGNGLAVAVAAGLFFPITWAVWYLRDEHPYRRERHNGDLDVWIGRRRRRVESPNR